MIAARWQAWAALGVVVAAMIAFFVLGDRDTRDPRRQWSYDRPKRGIMDHVVDGVFDRSIGYHVYLEPKETYTIEEAAPPPAAAVEPSEIQVRVTPTGISIDGGSEQADELALAILTIKARIDPALQVMIELDEGVAWSRVIQVMDAAKTAGVENIALGRTL